MYAAAMAVMLLAAGNVSAQRGDSYRHNKDRGHHNKGRYHGDGKQAGKSNFSNRIYRMTDADSLQSIKMKPVVDRTSKRLDALRISYQKQEQRVMDSLKLQLKPILKEEQLKSLDRFSGEDRRRGK